MMCCALLLVCQGQNILGISKAGDMLHLQNISEVFVCEVRHSEVLLGIALHEPSAALALRVY